MSSSKDDPRDASLEVAYSLPKAWYLESTDGLATSGMFLAGLIMVTRNRFLAWPATLVGINTLVNQHPLRQKESMAGWSNVGRRFDDDDDEAAEEEPGFNVILDGSLKAALPPPLALSPTSNLGLVELKSRDEDGEEC
ncbi:hypothetical protein H1R20_g11754, partial [Candolleomyces eurysporus]